jgi:hypothetical protein
LVIFSSIFFGGNMPFPRPCVYLDGMETKQGPGMGVTFGVQCLVFSDAATTVVPSDLIKGLWNITLFSTAKVITLPTVADMDVAFADLNVGEGWSFFIKGGANGGSFSLPSGWTATSGTTLFNSLQHIVVTKTGTGAYSLRIS